MKIHSEMFIIGSPLLLLSLLLLLLLFIDPGALGPYNVKPEAISPKRFGIKPNTVRTKLPLSPSWLP